MKISVSSYSFSQLMNKGEMTQADCVEKAKELGFDAIEFSGIIPEEGYTPIEYAKHIRERAEKAGIEIISFCVGARLIRETEEDTRLGIQETKDNVDLAEALGVKLMRHDAYYWQNKYRSFDLSLPELAQNIREVADYAASKGIRTMVENHGFICQGSERMERLFNAVNHPNFGLLCDIGNFLCVDENPITAVSRVAPYAIHAHVKDFYVHGFDYPSDECIVTTGCNKILGAPAGYGDVPVKQCIAILKKAGYEGAFSLEYEGKEECIHSIEKALAFLRTIED